MLTDYLQAAMKAAHYEILPDDNSYYGENPGFDGVYANASTLEDCRTELAEVLEEWILFRLTRNMQLPHWHRSKCNERQNKKASLQARLFFS